MLPADGRPPRSRARVATVAVLLSVVLAGCAAGPSATPTSPAPTPGESPAGGPTSTETPTPDPSPTPPTTTEGYYRSYEFTLGEVTPADVARAVATPVDEISRQEERWSVAIEGTRNGTATAVGTLDPAAADAPAGENVPFENGSLVRRNDTYYRLHLSVATQHERRAFRFGLEGPIREGHRNYDEAEARAVDVENLSVAGQRAVLTGMPSDEELDGIRSFSSSYYVFFENDTLPSGAVLGDDEVDYVRYEGRYYRVEPAEPQRVLRRVVRYRFVVAANSTAAFADEATARYVVNTSAAPVEAEPALSRLLERGSLEWSGTGDPPGGYEALWQWVEETPPADWGRAFVRHDGRLYRIRAAHAVE